MVMHVVSGFSSPSLEYLFLRVLSIEHCSGNKPAYLFRFLKLKLASINHADILKRRIYQTENFYEFVWTN